VEYNANDFCVQAAPVAVVENSDPFIITVEDPCQPWDCKLAQCSEVKGLDNIEVKIKSYAGTADIPEWTNTIHTTCYPDN
jgi:hypothetical protein